MAEKDEEITAQAVVSMQGDIIRSRVPTHILQGVGLEHGDGIDYHVAVDKEGPYFWGRPMKGAGPEISARTKATAPSAKAGAKKAGAKKSASKKAQSDDVLSAFGGNGADEDDVWGDESSKKVAPAPRKTPPAVGGKVLAPTKVAAPKVQAPAAVIGKKAGAKRSAPKVKYDLSGV